MGLIEAQCPIATGQFERASSAIPVASLWPNERGGAVIALGQFCARHHKGHLFASSSGALVALNRCQEQPLVGLDAAFAGVRLSVTEARAVTAPAKIILGSCVSAFGGFANPEERFGVVAGHTMSAGVHQPEVVLGQGMPLFSGLAIPLRGLRRIWSVSAAVLLSQTELRDG